MNDPNVDPPREPLPTRAEADAILSDPDVVFELAYYGHKLRTRDELAARLEQVAVRHDRASDGFAERKRYDLAAAEREQARSVRRWAEALRVVHSLTRM